jgi:hypothetical protein
MAGWIMPPAVYFQHGAYFLTHKTQWIRLGRIPSRARKRFAEIAPQLKGDDYARRYVYLEDDDSSGPIPRRFLSEILRNAKKNAKSRNLEFSITLTDLKDLAMAGSGRCALTGIEFEYGISQEAAASKSRRKRLWAPSIDRIDPDIGYTPANIRIICSAVNIARQEFSDEILLKIAFGLSKMATASAGNQDPARVKTLAF